MGGETVSPPKSPKGRPTLGGIKRILRDDAGVHILAGPYNQAAAQDTNGMRVLPSLNLPFDIASSGTRADGVQKLPGLLFP